MVLSERRGGIEVGLAWAACGATGGVERGEEQVPTCWSGRHVRCQGRASYWSPVSEVGLADEIVGREREVHDG